MLSIKDLTKLEKKRFRDDEGVFLIEGKKVFEEAQKAQLNFIQVLATDRFVRENSEFLREHKLNYQDLTVINEHNAERLSDTSTPSGLFAVIKKPEMSLEKLAQSNTIAVLENIRDPGNLGTMIRTADWFGITSILLSSDGVDIYNGKVLRATMGSLFHLNIFTSLNLENDLLDLKKQGFQIIVTRPEGKKPLQSIKAEKNCIVFGNESLGTSSEVDALADEVFTIPKFGSAESLNVAVAFGITCHQLLQGVK